MGSSVACCNSSSVSPDAALVEASPTDGKAVIRVVGARGLRPRSWEPSDADECWCVVSLEGQEAFRTKNVRNMLEPVWQHEQEVNGFDRSRGVELSIHDASGCLGKTKLAWCRGFNGEADLLDCEAGATLRVKVKHPTDDDFPVGPPSEFKFRVQRDSTDVKWGMRLDTQNPTGLLVDKVEENGPVSASNKALPSERRIKKHDVIVDVNGTRGNTGGAMMKDFADKTDVTVTVQRSVEMLLVLERASVDTSIGLEFPPKPKGTSLVVVKLLPGLVSDYNASEKDESLKVNLGDRVMAVNGQEDTAEGLIKKLSDATGTCRLSILKLVPASSEELVGGKAFWYYGDGL